MGQAATDGADGRKGCLQQQRSSRGAARSASAFSSFRAAASTPMQPTASARSRRRPAHLGAALCNERSVGLAHLRKQAGHALGVFLAAPGHQRGKLIRGSLACCPAIWHCVTWLGSRAMHPAPPPVIVLALGRGVAVALRQRLLQADVEAAGGGAAGAEVATWCSHRLHLTGAEAKRPPGPRLPRGPPTCTASNTQVAAHAGRPCRLTGA